MKIHLDDTVHNFRKKNVVTLEDDKGMYDLMECTECGTSGKCRDFVSITYEGRRRAKAERCNMTKKEHDAFLAKLRYNMLSEKDEREGVRCPNDCGEKPRVESEWIEEETRAIVFKCLCACGYSGFIQA